MHQEFMRQAIGLAVENAQTGRGGPFGALIVREGLVVATGTNLVTSRNDPTAHAEVIAIREACAALGRFTLEDCTLYTSCEPCPMCLGAGYWARLAQVYYCARRQDAAAAGFDDASMYEELCRSIEARRLPMLRLLPEAAAQPFAAWDRFEGRKQY